MLDVLKRVERRGHYETAIRLRSFAGRVFRYAFATLRTEQNPADILRGALTIPRVKHHAAIIEPKKVGDLLRAIQDYAGRPETQYALRIAPHVFLRPGELRQAKWAEIDFAGKVWRVPAERMKMKQEHLVPLSRQVIYLLQELRSVARGGEFLFPALHTIKRPFSDNTMNVALRWICSTSAGGTPGLSSWPSPQTSEPPSIGGRRLMDWLSTLPVMAMLRIIAAEDRTVMAFASAAAGCRPESISDIARYQFACRLAWIAIMLPVAATPALPNAATFSDTMRPSSACSAVSPPRPGGRRPGDARA